MKNIYGSILITTVLLFILFDCSPSTIIIKEHNQNEIISINKGDIAKVILKANPSTGYIWSIENIDNLLVKILDESYVAKKVKKDIVGSGGNKIYLIKTMNKGKTTIEFKYSRPFEEELPSIKKILFTLEIR